MDEIERKEPEEVDSVLSCETESLKSDSAALESLQKNGSVEPVFSCEPAPTLRTLFDQSIEQLRLVCAEDATREAELLLCYVLGKDRAYLYAYGEIPVDEEAYCLLSSMLAERLTGKPLQYILGTTEFMGLTLEVNPAVLIPRQDTELLAETAIEMIFHRSVNMSEAGSSNFAFGIPHFDVLDLCTGSGAVAIAIAKLAYAAIVTATDISQEALDIATRNAAAAELSRPIFFVQGDLFAALPPGSKFDMIVSNPPYIASAVVESLETNVRDHEPRIALDGGADGLDFIKRILAEAPFHLKPGGQLLMEIGYDQGLRALALATEPSPQDPTKPLFAKAHILKDLGGNDRVLVASME